MPVVYYLRAHHGAIKIGTTVDVSTRFDRIARSMPRMAPLTLLATEPGGPELERQRHREFERSRVIGEWFAPTEALLAHIAALS
jgi:hypothetical protein